MKRALIMHETDNVATMIEDVQRDDDVCVGVGADTVLVRALEPVPFGFKIALKAVAQGAPIVKYGEIIGTATVAIARGAVVHIHNVVGCRARGDLPCEDRR